MDRGWYALIAVLLTFAVAAVLIYRYPGGTELFAKTDIAWLGGQASDIRFSIALDGLSLWLFGLTALLTVVAVLVSWEAIAEQASLYYRLLLILETGMLGVFTARDIILFYVFFEFTLIPLFFIIGIWGHQQRRYAAIKFFIFTLAGSMLTFLGLLAIVIWDYHHPIGDPAAWKMTFSIPALTGSLAIRPMDPAVQTWIFLGAVCRVCRQSAAGSVAYMAAAGTRRGAYGRERNPGRRAAEDRDLRIRPIQPADAALCLGLFHAFGALVGVGGRHLRFAGRIGSKGHQAVDSLFQRGPHGILHDRFV